MSLRSRVVIVTGGGRGIGRAMAFALAEAGARVIVSGARERAEIESVAEEAERRFGEPRIVPLVADVMREDDCARLVELAFDRFGRLDVLVNNAGRGMKYVSDAFLTVPPRFWTVEPEAWRMVIETNVVGPFLMARAAAPAMIEAGWGRIVNISMNHETMRRRGFSPYGPSKAALESETIIWAQDLAGTGITVNALLPGGATATGMISSELPAQPLGETSRSGDHGSSDRLARLGEVGWGHRPPLRCVALARRPAGSGSGPGRGRGRRLAKG